MAANRRRRFTPVATAVAAVALTAPLATGCEFGDTLDCLTDAEQITDSITAINKARAVAIEDPTRPEESIATIEGASTRSTTRRTTARSTTRSRTSTRRSRTTTTPS